MKTLWGTIVASIALVILVFGVPMLFTTANGDIEPILLELEPMSAEAEGDEVLEPPPVPRNGDEPFWEKVLEKTIENIQETIWFIFQTFIVVRFIKKRGD
jgi:hypothetical protein